MLHYLEVMYDTVNNKLLVGGIFCGWEKVFGCVDHGILLYKLKYYGINSRDLVLCQPYLDNRYFRTTIYNDSNNSNKVSSWAKFRRGDPQCFVLGPLLFLQCIVDSQKIINKTSAPIIFAGDTSIIISHPNLTYFNKNIHIFL
jgi:hypothetical protein